MSFPLINKRNRQAVVVPDLSGGMNLRDSVSMVSDNQLTDSVNMWFRDGVLKTRPGLNNMRCYEGCGVGKEAMRAHDIYAEKTTNDKKFGSLLDGDTKECRLFSCVLNGKIHFYWIGETYFKALPEIELSDEESYFVVFSGSKLYCFIASLKIYVLKESSKILGTYEWVEVVDYSSNDTDDVLYAPLALTNGLSTCQNENSVGITDEFSGDKIEPFNLLTNKYRAIYSTVNRDLLVDGVEKIKMIYSLPFGCENLEGKTFTAKHTVEHATLGTVTYTHSVTLKNNFSGVEEEPLLDGLRMVVYPKKIMFYSGTSTDIATVTESDYRLNNLEITAYAEFDSSLKTIYADDLNNKIFNMSRAIWFGGAAEGISGGTRLFLCGNSKEPNLVVWSDLNNPLYFPENNYFYVGDTGSAVTGFGKQSDMLVIYKNRETYYTQYAQNSSITSEDLVSKNVVDYVSSSVYFPLTLIHPNIGCDCPDTVQLCRNRLVWTNSDGRVYTLVTNNQYSERNIYEVGEMIHRRLKTESDLKNARSADWNGYYLLQTGKNIYVLDYNSYGYQYVSSYSKNEDANLKIPWYFWSLDCVDIHISASVAAVIDGKLALLFAGRKTGAYGSMSGLFKAFFDEEQVYDGVVYADTDYDYAMLESPINSQLQTKLFEFGAQGYYKNVEQVILSLGNNGGAPINVGFVTDMGTEEEEVTIDCDEAQPYSAGYIKSVQFNPCIRQVERFGVKLECAGPLAVDAITLKYRITGGVR